MVGMEVLLLLVVVLPPVEVWGLTILPRSSFAAWALLLSLFSAVPSSNRTRVGDLFLVVDLAALDEADAEVVLALGLGLLLVSFLRLVADFCFSVPPAACCWVCFFLLLAAALLFLAAGFLLVLLAALFVLAFVLAVALSDTVICLFFLLLPPLPLFSFSLAGSEAPKSNEEESAATLPPDPRSSSDEEESVSISRSMAVRLRWELELPLLAASRARPRPRPAEAAVDMDEPEPLLPPLPRPGRRFDPPVPSKSRGILLLICALVISSPAGSLASACRPSTLDLYRYLGIGVGPLLSPFLESSPCLFTYLAQTAIATPHAMPPKQAT